MGAKCGPSVTTPPDRPLRAAALFSGTGESGQAPRQAPGSDLGEVCLILGSLAMVASGTVAVLPRIVAGWATGDVQGTLLPDKVLGSNIDGPVNVLLLGIDQRSGNTTELIRTVTMIICIFRPRTTRPTWAA